MEHWESFWKNEKFKPIVLGPPPAILYGGTNQEPLASIGMSCFLDAVREDFKPGFSVIDYGCGAGILSNFISARLQDFKYVGLEPDSQHGWGRIALGERYFKDPRVSFGTIEEDFNEKIKNKVDAVVLISVFTHLALMDVYTILDGLIEVFERNPKCSIVFSCFIAEKSEALNHQPHIWERFYGEAYLSLADLRAYTDACGLKLEKHMDFTAMGGFVHSIFKISRP